MGSIPPAASIEFPQREIVAAIAAAGLIPTNTDLAQLLKALKLIDICNKFKAGVNQGTSTQWSVAITPLPVTPLLAGSAIWVKPVYPSQTGGTVLSVNGGLFYPVVLADLSPITLGDILPNGWVLCLFDGAHWQVIAGCVGRVPGQLPALHANANWYVNGATGNDTTYDGTSPNVMSATIGPFKTVQRGVDETAKYNMNGYDQNVFVADGSYVGGIFLRQTNGAGRCHLIGNQGSSQSVNISATGNLMAIFQAAGSWDVRGFRLSAPGPGALGWGLVLNGGDCQVANLAFGPCSAYHFGGTYNSQVSVAGGKFIIEAGANALSHMFAANGATIIYSSAALATLEIHGNVSFVNAFAETRLGAIIQMTYSSISAKSAVHGKMYSSNENSVIATLGGGPNAYPGDLPGEQTFGGQYIP